MIHRALAGLLTSLTLGCATASRVPSGVAQPDHWTLAAAERFARDLELPLLRVAEPGVDREIRIWALGGGYMIPDQLVRIREHRGRVSGRFFEAWPLPDAAAHAGVRDPRRYGLMGPDGWDDRTRNFECRSGRHARLCEWRATAAVDWSDLLRSLDALEIGRPPSGPGCPTGMDGFHLVVEIQSADGYRHYRCWAPGDENPEAARMRRIIDTIRNSLFPWAGKD